MAIPKIIHYFWFGNNEMSELTKECIKSWKKYCPDYKFKLWNEDNFNIHYIPFIEDAYNAKKWAFVADFARFYVLYKEGGIYIETDAKLLKPIDKFLNNGAFIGLGKDDITVCVFGMEKNNSLAKAVIEYYKNVIFDINNLKTVNNIVYQILIKKFGLEKKDEFQRLKGNICIYPTEYFLTDWQYGALNSHKSYVFHYADGSWLNDELRDQKKIILKCIKIFGNKYGWNIGYFIYYVKYNGLNKALNKVKEKLFSKINPYYVKYCPFKVKKNKIIFDNFKGLGYGYDPKYLCENLRKMNKFDIAWVVKDLADNSVPNDIRKIKINSLKYYYEMSTAKVWVDNVRKTNEIYKRPGQYYLQTWHGSIPLKKIEKDAMHILSCSYINNAIHDSKMIDIIPSSCKTRTNIIKNAFWYDGDIIECGCPRNDLLFKKENTNSIIKKKLGIQEDSILLVYAPTFRQNGSLDAYDIDFKRLRETVGKVFNNKKVYCMVRLHPLLRNCDIKKHYGSNIIDGSKIEDAQQLFLEADILISDYSDCLFETALKETPVFIYASDIDNYMKERDFYISLYDLPFPIAQNNDELIKNIKLFDIQKYKNLLNIFWNNQGLFDKGNATELLSDWIIRKCMNK